MASFARLLVACASAALIAFAPAIDHGWDPWDDAGFALAKAGNGNGNAGGNGNGNGGGNGNSNAGGNGKGKGSAGGNGNAKAGSNGKSKSGKGSAGTVGAGIGSAGPSLKDLRRLARLASFAPVAVSASPGLTRSPAKRVATKVHEPHSRTMLVATGVTDGQLR